MLLDLLDPDLRVVLLTARPERIHHLTEAWLRGYSIRWDLLIMRAVGRLRGGARLQAVDGVGAARARLRAAARDRGRPPQRRDVPRARASRASTSTPATTTEMAEATLLALGSAVLHAGWNLLSRRATSGSSPRGASSSSAGSCSCRCCSFVGLPGSSALPYLAASSLVHVVYVAALVAGVPPRRLLVRVPARPRRGRAARRDRRRRCSSPMTSRPRRGSRSRSSSAGSRRSCGPERRPDRARLGRPHRGHHRRVHDARRRRRPPARRGLGYGDRAGARDRRSP